MGSSPRCGAGETPAPGVRTFSNLPCRQGILAGGPPVRPARGTRGGRSGGVERPTASWHHARNVPTKEDGCQAREVSYSLARAASPFRGIRREVQSGRAFQTARVPRKGDTSRPVRATPTVNGSSMMRSTDRQRQTHREVSTQSQRSPAETARLPKPGTAHHAASAPGNSPRVRIPRVEPPAMDTIAQRASEGRHQGRAPRSESIRDADGGRCGGQCH